MTLNELDESLSEFIQMLTIFNHQLALDWDKLQRDWIECDIIWKDDSMRENFVREWGDMKNAIQHYRMFESIRYIEFLWQRKQALDEYFGRAITHFVVDELVLHQAPVSLAGYELDNNTDSERLVILRSQNVFSRSLLPDKTVSTSDTMADYIEREDTQLSDISPHVIRDPVEKPGNGIAISSENSAQVVQNISHSNTIIQNISIKNYLFSYNIAVRPLIIEHSLKRVTFDDPSIGFKIGVSLLKMRGVFARWNNAIGGGSSFDAQLNMNAGLDKSESGTSFGLSANSFVGLKLNLSGTQWAGRYVSLNGLESKLGIELKVQNKIAIENGWPRIRGSLPSIGIVTPLSPGEAANLMIALAKSAVGLFRKQSTT